MAYCVQCGVKIADGAPVCPLCNTAVILPPSVVEPKAQPLFAQPLKLGNGSGITKWRKGVFELAFALAVVSIVAVGLSLGLSGLGRYSFIPIFSIAWVTATLGICLYAKPTYVREATIILVATALYLVGLDLFDLALSWSLIAAPALLVLWVVAVAPWTGMKVRGVLALALDSLLLYLLLLNLVVAGALTWFVPVALPSVLVLVASSLFSLFFLGRKHPSSLVDGDGDLGNPLHVDQLLRSLPDPLPTWGLRVAVVDEPCLGRPDRSHRLAGPYLFTAPQALLHRHS